MRRGGGNTREGNTEEEEVAAAAAAEEEKERDASMSLMQMTEECLETARRGLVPSLDILSRICDHPDYLGFTSLEIETLLSPLLRLVPPRFANGRHPSHSSPEELRSLLCLLVPSESLEGCRGVTRLLLWGLVWDRRSGTKKGGRLAKTVLTWVNYLLYYSLFPSESLSVCYEPLLLHMDVDRELRPLISDLIIAMTTRAEDVKRCRIDLVVEMLGRSGGGSKPRERRALVSLLNRFRFLRPDIVTQDKISFSRRAMPTTAATSAAPAIPEMLDRFDRLWRDRLPIDVEFDDLVRESRITWDNDEVFKKELKTNMEDDDENETRGGGRRLARHVLPGPDPNPLSTRTTTLQSCTTVGDVLRHLPHLQPPGQTLSLLNNRGTFFLLMANAGPKETRTRLSVTLYHMLHREFFGIVSPFSADRRRFLLQRICQLQDFMREGMPVVARFLAEYLAGWDGRECFMEIMGLIEFIQITDFEELYDCILAPLSSRFSTTFGSMERTFYAIYLNRLLLHWIHLEHDRCKSSVDTRLCGASNPDCRNPLGSISELLKHWISLAELGLAKSIFQSDVKGRLDKGIYFNEVLTMCLMTTRLLIEKEIPLRLDLPPSFLYQALFEPTPIYLNRVLEHIAVIKHETVPLCHRTFKRLNAQAEQMESTAAPHVILENLEAERRVVLEHLENKERLNALTKDALAVLSNRTVYLERNQSLFRKDWQIEDEFIRASLSVTSHPAFLPFVIEFVDRFAEGNGLTREEVHTAMQDEGSQVYASYMAHLSQFLPRIAEFLETFGAGRGRQLLQLQPPSSNCTASQSSADGKSNVTTSGISSMHPARKRRRIS